MGELLEPQPHPFRLVPPPNSLVMKALCGRMGGKIRSEYAMVGDVINLAARLMGKAKGRIVCDEVTHDLVRTEDTYTKYDSMTRSLFFFFASNVHEERDIN